MHTMNNMQTATIEWMLENADNYNNAIDLANGAIDRFNLDTPSWIWDEAQEIFDLNRERRNSDRYA